MNIIERVINHFRELPEKKRYLEFITALLTIPVLLSVVYMNYTSIKDKNKPEEKEDTKPTVITIVQDKDEEKKKNTPTPTDKPECRPEVGDAQILSPEENETVSANPLTISIIRNNSEEEYCAIVWSYRINNGSWSNYDDKDISIYNLDSGQKTLEVRVKSLISGKEKALERHFTYKDTDIQPTPTPTSTPSSTPTITVGP